MSIWGRRVDDFVSGRKPADHAGWRDDPDRPGIERYWTGREWADDIAPRAKPEPAWKQARMVTLGILIAAAVLFTVWRMQQPTELECLEQATDVVTGDRFAVEDACLNR